MPGDGCESGERPAKVRKQSEQRGDEDAGGGLLSVHLKLRVHQSAGRRRGCLKRLVRDLPEIAHRLFAATNAADLPQQWRASADACLHRATRSI
jgi:hypothetical protein